MLVTFRFKNSWSFFKENVFSMECTSDKQYEGLNTFLPEGHLLARKGDRLLKNALIFGPTASGKTNILRSLIFMRSFILCGSAPYPRINSNETFAYFEGVKDEESLYEVELIENHAFYDYGFKLRNGEITEEWLKKREPNKRLTLIFFRKDEEISILGYTKKQAQCIHPQKGIPFIINGWFLGCKKHFMTFNDVNNWFRRLVIKLDDENVSSLCLENPQYLDRVEKILKYAGIMIDMNGSDAETKDKDSKVLKETLLNAKSSFISKGTAHLINVLIAVLKALDYGDVLFLDNMDENIFYSVAKYVIEMTNSISSNPKNAQVIGIINNPFLMDINIRRDQIYFVSKNEKGESELTSLSDYIGVRKDELYSRRFLAGIYSDVPKMM